MFSVILLNIKFQCRGPVKRNLQKLNLRVPELARRKRSPEIASRKWDIIAANELSTATPNDHNCPIETPGKAMCGCL
jgi:hypothetical protein